MSEKPSRKKLKQAKLSFEPQRLDVRAQSETTDLKGKRITH